MKDLASFLNELQKISNEIEDFYDDGETAVVFRKDKLLFLIVFVCVLIVWYESSRTKRLLARIK